MDQYLPPLVAVTTGVVVIFFCFTLRIPFFLVGLLSIGMMLYAFQDHIVQFSYQYSNMSAPSFFKNNASILITTLVIIISLGFLLFAFGPRAIVSNQQTVFDRNQSGKSSGFFDMFRGSGSDQDRRRNRSYNTSDYGRSSAYDYAP